MKIDNDPVVLKLYSQVADYRIERKTPPPESRRYADPEYGMRNVNNREAEINRFKTPEVQRKEFIPSNQVSGYDKNSQLTYYNRVGQNINIKG